MITLLFIQKSFLINKGALHLPGSISSQRTITFFEKIVAI